MDKAYVSDFTKFMDQFLKVHPEVVEEQMSSWASFWDLKIFPDTMHMRKEDFIRDDHYGFG